MHRPRKWSWHESYPRVSICLNSPARLHATAYDDWKAQYIFIRVTWLCLSLYNHGDLLQMWRFVIKRFRNVLILLPFKRAYWNTDSTGFKWGIKLIYMYIFWWYNDYIFLRNGGAHDYGKTYQTTEPVDGIEHKFYTPPPLCNIGNANNT